MTDRVTERVTIGPHYDNSFIAHARIHELKTAAFTEQGLSWKQFFRL